jgi:hypothetical protein
MERCDVIVCVVFGGKKMMTMIRDRYYITKVLAGGLFGSSQWRFICPLQYYSTVYI